MSRTGPARGRSVEKAAADPRAVGLSADEAAAEPRAVSPSAVLAALAEPRRAAIVSLLEERHRSQKGLAGELAISQPLVSHHLRILREAGLVTSTVCDRVTVYLLNPRTLRALSRRLEGAAERAESVERVPPC